MAEADEIVRVLAVTPLEEDYISLLHIFSHSNWQMHRVCTCQETVDFLRGNQTPVVIAERELPDGSWKQILAEATQMPNPPRLIVACRAADDQLWAEVLDLGGYDVLGKPFDRSEVVRVISLAWRQWKDERARSAKGGQAPPDPQLRTRKAPGG